MGCVWGKPGTALPKGGTLGPLCSSSASLWSVLGQERLPEYQVVGTLQQMETASSPGREELLNFGMVLAVCSRLGLCVSPRRGPGCFGLRSSALGSLILHVLPSLRLEHPSLSGYRVTVS